jgi:hypothetical protein
MYDTKTKLVLAENNRKSNSARALSPCGVSN